MPNLLLSSVCTAAIPVTPGSGCRILPGHAAAVWSGCAVGSPWCHAVPEAGCIEFVLSEDSPSTSWCFPLVTSTDLSSKGRDSIILGTTQHRQWTQAYHITNINSHTLPWNFNHIFTSLVPFYCQCFPKSTWAHRTFLKKHHASYNCLSPSCQLRKTLNI